MIGPPVFASFAAISATVSDVRSLEGCKRYPATTGGVADCSDSPHAAARMALPMVAEKLDAGNTCTILGDGAGVEFFLGLPLTPLGLFPKMTLSETTV